MNSSLGILKFHIEIPRRGWGMIEREVLQRGILEFLVILDKFKLRNSRIPKCLYISAYIFSSLIASLSMMPMPRFSVFFAISCASYKECIL